VSDDRRRDTGEFEPSIVDAIVAWLRKVRDGR
jgi:hypothetical protein